MSPYDTNLLSQLAPNSRDFLSALQALRGQTVGTPVTPGPPVVDQSMASSSLQAPSSGGGFMGALRGFAGGINNRLTQAMGNPLFGFGTGMLAAQSAGQSPLAGAVAGLYGTQLFKQRQQENDLKMQEAKLQKENMLTVSRLAQEGLKTLDVDQDGNISPVEQARADYLRLAAQTGDPTYLGKASETLASLQQNAPKPTALMNEADALFAPGSPEWRDYIQSGRQRPGVVVQNQERIPPPPAGFRYVDASRPELGLEFVQGGPQDPGNPANWTEAERNAAGFHQRLVASGNKLSQLEAPTIQDFAQTFGTEGTIENLLSSDKYREYRDYATDWIRAKLRKESGAVIGDKEMRDEYRTYFWEPGDTEKDNRRKLALRLAAERQLSMSAGRAAMTADRRAKELRDAGMSDDDIAATLVDEGWIK